MAKEERQQLAQRGQEVQKSREQRRTLEAKAVAPPARVPPTREQVVRARAPDPRRDESDPPPDLGPPPSTSTVDTKPPPPNWNPDERGPNTER